MGLKMGYKANQADLSRDKDAVVSFWNGIQQRPLDAKFEWIYLGNPNGKASLWMVHHEETSALSGMTALFPRIFSIKEDSRYCAVAGDLLVHPKHRSLGPALMLQRNVVSKAKNGEYCFIYGFPNKSAEAVWKRIGYKFLGPTVRLTKVLRTSSLLKKYAIPKALSYIFSPLIDFGLYLFSAETWKFKSKDYICRFVDFPDERFDRFYEKLKKQYSVVGQRDSEFLKWKYLNDPDDKHQFFAVFNSSEDELHGYIAFCRSERRASVRDFAFGNNEAANESLVVYFLKHMRKQGSEAVTFRFLENNELISFFKKYQFVKRADEGNIYYYTNDKSMAGIDHKNAGNWFITIGDQDT